MIRFNNNLAKAMEFTSFKKRENVTDNELLFAVLKFETVLVQQKGIIFHCLVRSYNNDYANVLFADSIDVLKDLGKNLGHLPEVQSFFEMVDTKTVKIEYHEIQKDNFQIPKEFSCIEKGTFSLNDIKDSDQLLSVSEKIENEYLDTFENTQAHFIGILNENQFSEVTFGKTLAKTKQICFGYFDNPYGLELLNLADKESMELDFWYLIG
ncbi:hypothetical protein [Chryseobacterium sp. T1]